MRDGDAARLVVQAARLQVDQLGGPRFQYRVLVAVDDRAVLGGVGRAVAEPATSPFSVEIRNRVLGMRSAAPDQGHRKAHMGGKSAGTFSTRLSSEHALLPKRRHVDSELTP